MLEDHLRNLAAAEVRRILGAAEAHHSPGSAEVRHNLAVRAGHRMAEEHGRTGQRQLG